MPDDIRDGDRVWHYGMTYSGPRPADEELGTVIGFVAKDGERYAVVEWPLDAPERRTVHLPFELLKAAIVEVGDIVQEKGTSKVALNSPAQCVLAIDGEWLWVRPVNGGGNPWTIRKADARLMRKGP